MNQGEGAQLSWWEGGLPSLPSGAQGKAWVWADVNTQGEVPVVVETCPPKRYLQVLTPVPVSATFSGNKVLADVIKEGKVLGVGPNPI